MQAGPGPGPDGTKDGAYFSISCVDSDLRSLGAVRAVISMLVGVSLAVALNGGGVGDYFWSSSLRSRSILFDNRGLLGWREKNAGGDGDYDDGAPSNISG